MLLGICHILYEGLPELPCFRSDLHCLDNVDMTDITHIAFVVSKFGCRGRSLLTLASFLAAVQLYVYA